MFVWMLHPFFSLTLHDSRSSGNRVDLHHAFRQTCQNFASRNWRLGQKWKKFKAVTVLHNQAPQSARGDVGCGSAQVAPLFAFPNKSIAFDSTLSAAVQLSRFFPDVSFRGLWVWVLLAALIDSNALPVTMRQQGFALLLAWMAACLSQLYLS